MREKKKLYTTEALRSIIGDIYMKRQEWWERLTKGMSTEEIATVAVEQGGVLLAILQVYTPFLVGSHVERVEPLEYGKHAAVQVKEGGRVLFLLQVESHVGLVVLCLNSLVPKHINTFV